MKSARHPLRLSRMRIPLVISVVLAVAAGTVGWNWLNSPTGRAALAMQRAEIALSHGRPSLAAEYVDTALAVRPHDPGAVELKARALLRMKRFDESRAVLDGLMHRHPGRADVRRRMVEWGVTVARDALNGPDFATDRRRQDRFQSALAVVGEQVGWFASRDTPDYRNEAELIRVRVDALDVHGLRVIRDERRSEIDSGTLEGEARRKCRAAVLDIDKRIEARLDDAEGRLRAVLDRDPRNTAAATRYCRLLAERGAPSTLNAFADELASRKDLPPALLDTVVAALLAAPMTNARDARPVEIGRRLLGAVEESKRGTPGWMMAAARIRVETREYQEARRLLRGVLKTLPTHRDARYLLGRTLFELGEFAEAKRVLAALCAEPTASAVLQSLFGRTLLENGDTHLAETVLHRALSIDPGDGPAREALMRLKRDQGRAAEVVEDVYAYYGENKDDPRAARAVARLEQARLNSEALARLLEEVESLETLRDEHLLLLADGYTALGRPERAEAWARRLVLRTPQGRPGRLALAEAVLAQGKHRDAARLIDQFDQTFPGDLETVRLRATLHLRRERFDQAAELLQRFVDARPDNDQARLQRAYALFALAQVDAAIDQIRTVLDHDPHNIPACAMMLRIRRFIGDAAGIEETLARVNADDVDERFQPALAAQLHLYEGAPERAEAVCRRALARGETDPALRLILSSISRKRQDVDVAEGHLMALVKSHPNLAPAYTTLTRFYVDQGALDRGIGVFETLRTASEPLARLAESLLLKRTGRPRQALGVLQDAYQPALASRGRTALRVARAMAALHADAGDLSAAIRVYDRLIEANLFSEEAILDRIELAADADGVDATVRRLSVLVRRLDPARADHRALGYRVLLRFVDLKRPDQSLALLDHWIERAPDEVVFLRWKAGLLMELDRPHEAAGVLRRATVLAPESVRVWQLLARAYRDGHDPPAAEAAYNRLGDIDACAANLARIDQARMFLDLGLGGRAIETLSSMDTTVRVRDPGQLLALGGLLHALGREDQARGRFDEIPRFARQFPTAQVRLARIELRGGSADDALARLAEVFRNPRTAASAAAALLSDGEEAGDAGRAGDGTFDSLFVQADALIDVDKLPEPLSVAWRTRRVAVAAAAADWNATLTALGELATVAETVPVNAARVAVLTVLDRRDRACRVYDDTPALHGSGMGPLLAAIVDRPPPGEPPPGRPDAMDAWIAALLRGDLLDAGGAVGAPSRLTTLYATDLAAVLQQPHVPADALRRLGAAWIAYETGLRRLADALCEQCIRSAPQLTPAYALRAQIAMDGGRGVESATVLAPYRVYASAFALDVDARFTTARADHTTAIALLEALRRREPQDDHVRYRLAGRLLAAGDVSAARAVLERLVAGVGPCRAVAANELALLLAGQTPKRLDEAFAIASGALPSGVTHAAHLDTLGWIEHLRGRDTAALKYLNAALAADNTEPETHAHLASVYEALGNTTWARYHGESAARHAAERGRSHESQALSATDTNGIDHHGGRRFDRDG